MNAQKVNKALNKRKRKSNDEDQGNVKSRRPQPKKVIKNIQNARIALASGKVAQEEIEVRKQRDLRTLYVKFKKNSPKDNESIKLLFPQSQAVRSKTRHGKNEVDVKFCFVEYSSEEDCIIAKSQLDKLSDLYFVDFVGEKSRNVKPATNSSQTAKSRPVNPIRLCVTGIPEDMGEETLRLLFPKSVFSVIKKNKSAGFVSFSNPGDAKAAFDEVRRMMAGDLSPGIPKLTVVFAKMEKLTKKETERQRIRKEKFSEKIAERFKRPNKSVKEDDEGEEAMDGIDSDKSAKEEEVNESVDPESKGNEAIAIDQESDDDDDDDDDEEEVENDEESDGE